MATNENTPTSPTATAAPAGADAPVKIKWDTSSLKSSYCNFVNANSTREEVVLNFGVNQTWDRGIGGELEMQLHHRIILSPYAAKRLHDLLGRLVSEHETRYGPLK
jgi:hypothetical protein